MTPGTLTGIALPRTKRKKAAGNGLRAGEVGNLNSVTVLGGLRIAFLRAVALQVAPTAADGARPGGLVPGLAPVRFCGSSAERCDWTDRSKGIGQSSQVTTVIGRTASVGCALWWGIYRRADRNTEGGRGRRRPGTRAPILEVRELLKWSWRLRFQTGGRHDEGPARSIRGIRSGHFVPSIRPSSTG